MSDKWSLISEAQPFIKKAWEKAGFQKPTPIQEHVIPFILEGKDVIAESPTGSGKTLAYLLPILNRLETDTKNPQVVVLAPSRELVIQITDEARKWSADSAIQSQAIIGGANVKRQVEALKKHPQVIVGTPGRVLELIQMKKLKMHEVKTIVLDEGDQLLSREHEEMAKSIIKSAQLDTQLLYFSATLPDEALRRAKELMEQPEVVTVEASRAEKQAVDHIYFVCEKREKVEVLRRYIHTGSYKALAFLNDVNELSVYSSKLAYKKLDNGVLHSEASKAEREKTLKDFRKGVTSLLLATDLAARGLDIKNLTHVIHVDLPATEEQYIHRSGRTGREGKSGTVVSIVTRSEERELKRICRNLNIPLAEKQIYGGKIMDLHKRPLHNKK